MRKIKFFNYIKNNILSTVTFSMGIAVVLSLLFVSYVKISAHIASQKEAGNNSSKVVILDAGHGGEDGGAVGVDGIVEKDINLAITLRHPVIKS